jgi:hypothetical protein
MQECYYSGAGNGSLCYELYDKSRLQPDIKLISNVADEIVVSMGQKINYWINTTTLLSADNIYGEQPTARFHGPKLLKFLISNLNESSLNIGSWGFNPEDELTAYITYGLFTKAMSGDSIYTDLQQDIEPKSGDVFQMVEYGNDRINGRGGNYFEITQKRDQDIADSLNPLGAHYAWKITAKRLSYSWQPNLPQETVNDQITDDTFYGKLSSNIVGELSSAPKTYIDSADTESKKHILDMSVNDTSMYGTYDLTD